MESLLGLNPLSEIDFGHHMLDFDMMDCNASFSSCMASSVNSFTDLEDDGFDSDILESTSINSLFDLFEEEVKKMESQRPSPASSPCSTSSTVVLKESVIMSNSSKPTSYSLISSSKSRPRFPSSNSLPAKRFTSSSGSTILKHSAPQSHSSPVKTNQLKASNASNLPRSLLKKKKKKKGISLLAKPIVKPTSLLASAKPVSQTNTSHITREESNKDQQKEAAKINCTPSTTSNTDKNNNSSSSCSNLVDMAIFNAYFPLEHDYCSFSIMEEMIAHHTEEHSKALIEKIIDLEDDEAIFSRHRRRLDDQWEEGHIVDEAMVDISAEVTLTSSIAPTFT